MHSKVGHRRHTTSVQKKCHVDVARTSRAGRVTSRKRGGDASKPQSYQVHVKQTSPARNANVAETSHKQRVNAAYR